MEFNKKNIINILIIATAIILIYQLCDNLQSIVGFLGYCFQIIFPFLLGLSVAFIINVPMRFVEAGLKKIGKEDSFFQKKVRIFSFLISLLIFVGVIFLVAFLVIPQLTVTITQIIDQIPKFTKDVSGLLATLQKQVPQLESIFGNLEEGWSVIGKALSKLSTDQIAGMFSSTVDIITDVVSGVATFFIAIVFAIYVLFQKEELGQNCKKFMYAFLPVKLADRTISLFRMADRTFARFLVGQCLEAVILGTMFVIVLSILGMPYSVMIGILIGVMSLIPIVGAFVGCFLGAFLILMVNPMQAVVFVIVFLVLQQIEGNLIYPRVVGSSVGLPSLWVLVGVTVGGKLMGIVGMLIGIPIISMTYTLLSRYVNVKLMVKRVSDYKWRNKSCSKCHNMKQVTKSEKVTKSETSDNKKK